MSLGSDVSPYLYTQGEQPTSNEWLDQILSTIALNNPNFASLKGRALSAPGNLLGSGNYPAAPGIGAAEQTGGTGQAITANPTTQSTSVAAPVTAAPAPTTATASAPVATSAPAGAPASSVSSAPASSAAAAAPAAAATPSATTPSAPALNPQTVNEIWSTMQANGGGTFPGMTTSQYDTILAAQQQGLVPAFLGEGGVFGEGGQGGGGGGMGAGGSGGVGIGGAGGEGGIGSGGGGGYQA